MDFDGKIIFEFSTTDLSPNFIGLSYGFSGFDDYGIGRLVKSQRDLKQMFSYPIVDKYFIKESDKIYFLNKQGKYIWKEK